MWFAVDVLDFLKNFFSLVLKNVGDQLVKFSSDRPKADRIQSEEQFEKFLVNRMTLVGEVLFTSAFGKLIISEKTFF